MFKWLLRQLDTWSVCSNFDALTPSAVPLTFGQQRMSEKMPLVILYSLREITLSEELTDRCLVFLIIQVFVNRKKNI